MPAKELKRQLHDQPALLQLAVRARAGRARRCACCRARPSSIPVSDDPLHIDFIRAAAGAARDRRGAGRVPQRGGIARPEARRRAQHRPARDRAELPGREHPGAARDRPDRPRDRRQRPYQRRQAARGRAADDHRPRLHDLPIVPPTDQGRGIAAAEAGPRASRHHGRRAT